ncbi:MAG: helix-turn-helix domain-containing protein [Solirubrobacterales bacterium]
MHGERLLTTRRAAELLNVTPRTVTNWIRADRVPYVRLPGGEYRLPLDGLLDSVSGSYDIRTEIENVIELEEGARAQAAADLDLTMAERLAHVHELSRQLTAIAGQATRS